MRRLDEVLLTYGPSDAASRNLLLRELPALPVTFDHRRPLELCETEALAADPWNAYLAVEALHALEPEAVARRFDVRGDEGKGFHADRERVAPDAARTARVLRALGDELALLVPPLATLAGAPAPAARHAVRCLAGLHVPEAFGPLEKMARAGSLAPLPLLALARSPSRRAQARTVELCDGGHFETPAPGVDARSVAVLAHVAWKGRIGALQRWLKTPGGPLAAALVLAGVSGPEALAMAGDLLRAADPWVRAHAYHSLGAVPEARALAIAACRREREPVCRRVAVGALARLGGPEAYAALLEELPGADPWVQGRILQLIASCPDPDVLARAAAASRGFLSSRQAYLRVPAVLIVAREEPAAILAPLTEMMGAGEPTQRLGAVYCLGFFAQASAAAALGASLRSDPVLEVALAAAASLARFPSGMAAGPLIDGLARPDPAVRLAILRAAAELDGAALEESLGGFAAGLGGAPAEPEAAELAYLGGLATARTGRRNALEAHGLTAKNPRAVVDAVLAAGVPLDAAAGRIPDSSPVEVLARRELARFLTGEADAVAKLAALLAGPGGATAVGAVRELVALLPQLASTRRFDRLMERLAAGKAETPANLALSGTVLVVPAPAAVGYTQPSGAVHRPVAPLALPAMAAQPVAPVSRSLEWQGRIPTYSVGDAAAGPAAPRAKMAALWAAAVVILWVLGWSFRDRMAPPAAAPGAPAAAPRRVAGLTVLRAFGRAAPGEATFAAGQALAPGAAFRAAGVLELGTPFPHATVTAAPGAGRLVSVSALAAPSSGHEMKLELANGTYRVDARPGASTVLLATPAGTVRAEMAACELVLANGHLEVTVRTGKVEVQPPSGGAVQLDGPARWESP